jgi:hypothetical protein
MLELLVRAEELAWGGQYGEVGVLTWLKGVDGMVDDERGLADGGSRMGFLGMVRGGGHSRSGESYRLHKWQHRCWPSITYSYKPWSW